MEEEGTVEITVGVIEGFLGTEVEITVTTVGGTAQGS